MDAASENPPLRNFEREKDPDLRALWRLRRKLRARGIRVLIESAPELADQAEDADEEEEAYREWLYNADLEPDETAAESDTPVSSAVRYPTGNAQSGGGCLASTVGWTGGCLFLIGYMLFPAFIVLILLLFLFG